MVDLVGYDIEKAYYCWQRLRITPAPSILALPVVAHLNEFGIEARDDVDQVRLLRHDLADVLVNPRHLVEAARQDADTALLDLGLPLGPVERLNGLRSAHASASSVRRRTQRLR